MNLTEMQQWVKTAKYVTSTREVDKCGNEEVTKIYEKDGVLYGVDYCNDYFCEKWTDEGLIRDEYEPYKVTPRIVEITVYDRVAEE
jgi:hypothetical protein